MKLVSIAVLLASCATAPLAAPDGEIRMILEQRATHTLDAAQLRAHIRDDVEFVNERGRLERGPAAVAESYGPPPAVVQLHDRIDDLHVRAAGDAVVATYHRKGNLVLGGAPVTKEWRVTEVFVRGPSGWQTASYHETVTWLPPVAHTGDPVRLDDYVGRYELFPGLVYEITRVGDKLRFGPVQHRDRREKPWRGPRVSRSDSPC
jgi:ketosteroid isomerase-like protein